MLRRCIHAARQAPRASRIARRPSPRALSHVARSPRGLAVAHQADDPRAVRQMRHETFERRGMKPEADRWLRARQPSRAAASEKVDGAGCAIHSSAHRAARRGCRRRRARTDRRRRAPPSAGRGSAARRSASNGTGHGRPRLADIGKRQMPLAAEHGFGLGKRLSACFRQPGKAIFADTDDGQPGISHDARPHSGRNEPMRTCSPRRSRARASTRSIPMAAAPRRRADQPLPTRIGGFGGVERACRLHPAGAHHACDRRDASLCSRDEPPCGGGLRGDRHAADRAGARALDQSARRQLDRGRPTSPPRSPRCPSSPRACSSPSAGSTSRRSRRSRSTPTRCDSSMPPERRCPAGCGCDRLARAVHARRRAGADARARHRLDRRPQLRRRRRARQDRRRPRARPARHHDRAAGAARTVAGGERGRGACSGSVIARASAHRPSGRRGASPNCRR